MSITLDVNAFLNKDVDCSAAECNPEPSSTMEAEEMETNIFAEIEHLLIFNKNLEHNGQKYQEQQEQNQKTETHKNCVEENPPPVTPTRAVHFNLDFLSPTDDFLLTNDSQSLMGDEGLLYTVEKDRLQPISAKFMVPGIYKRIDGTDSALLKTNNDVQSNVYITELENAGRIVRRQDFDKFYAMTNDINNDMAAQPPRKVLLLQALEDNDDTVEPFNVTSNTENQLQAVNKSTIIPKEEDALNRLAYNILKLTNRDHIVIDRKRNEIIRTKYSTKQKMIYKFLDYEALCLLSNENVDEQENEDRELQDKLLVLEKPKNKLGRPKTTPAKTTVKPAKTKSKTEAASKVNQVPNAPVTPTTTANAVVVRTRSGRLIKSVTINQDIAEDLQTPAAERLQEQVDSIMNDLKDSSYHNKKVSAVPKALPLPDPIVNNPTDIQTPTPAKRKVPPEAICPTCNKIFLGKRLNRHFAQHPDHIRVKPAATTTTTDQNESTQSASNFNDSSSSEDMTLFRFLISKLQKSANLNEDQRADLFLSELNDLIEQLQIRSSRLIRNTSGLHFVNQKTSKVLGIPEGQYALDLSAIELPIEESEMLENSSSINHSSHSNHHHHHHQRSLDYTNLSITLDDTLTDEAAQKLNLSAGGKLLPPSEESLLRAVGDLVQTNLLPPPRPICCAITESSSAIVVASSASSAAQCSVTASGVSVGNLLPPHIDHVSDNAVEAVSMKETPPNVVHQSDNPLLNLPVEFFNFNN